jgi:4-hydroxy-tetrahydrodipicolinate reductase
MQLLIYGPGRLGGAIAAAAVARGWPAPRVVTRPDRDGRRAPAPAADVAVDASSGASVAANLAHALDGGTRAFVIAATGWDGDVPLARSLLIEHGAAAVVAPNLSPGAALFARLVETAAGWYAAAGGFDPSIVEWHRRGKADRPSGTARALARRIAAADPRWSADGTLDDPRPALEVAGIRTGAAPGTHLVTFDGSGESVELRLAARDRSAYADGALAAARWVVAQPREPGLHPFDAVVDDILAASAATPVHA